jgi:hypothetical protein
LARQCLSIAYTMPVAEYSRPMDSKEPEDAAWCHDIVWQLCYDVFLTVVGERNAKLTNAQ